MTAKTKTALRTAGVLLALALVLVAVQSALAVTPGLYEVDGNPTCANLYQATVLSGPDPDLLDLGPLFGFKYDNNPTGDVSSTLTDNAPWVVTNGPQDSTNSVSIFNVVLDGGEGVQFDWSATLGIDAVIVKAQDSNAYVYSPEAFGASGLIAPDGKAVSHVEFCYDYELVAEKTARAEYTRTYTWEITKSVDPESHTGWFGDDFTSSYDVFVDQTVVDSDYQVTGNIIVSNPTPFTVTFSVDDSVGGTPATVSCPTLTLLAGESTTCTYQAALGEAVDGTNTATITSENSNVKGAEATADYTFGEPTTVVGHPTINVTDYFDGDLVGEGLGSASGDFTFSYERPFTCPSDVAEYTDGVYLASFPNTAKIDETGQFADAEVSIDCYLWDVAKTADGTYDEQYKWDITKTVDPESQSGFAGDPLNWTWTLSWSRSFDYELNHAVSGLITVTNPAPMELTVDVTDILTGGTAALVVCNDSDGGTSLTISKNSSGTCDYTAAPGSQVAQNTATATRGAISVDKTVSINWALGDQYGLTATVTDTNGQNQTVSADGGTSYPDQATCSTDAASYTDGTYPSGAIDNTATITWNDGSDSDSATTSYDCYLWDVTKTADGTYDEQYKWDITKTVDPESQSGFAGDTLNWTWSIEWESSLDYELNHDVSGLITVTNPAPMELTVDVTDYLTGSVATEVVCNDSDGGTSLTIAKNSSGTCGYTANDVGSQLADNTATATRNTVSVSSGAVAVNWQLGAKYGLEAAVDDSSELTIPFDTAQPFSYTESATCSTDAASYTDGTYPSGAIDNTATITWNDGSDSDSATTSYDCYLWDVTKTADGTYDEQYKWEITKTVDPESQSGFAGDTLSWTWTLSWSRSFDFELNHDVSGLITVTNPAPMELTVDVTDYLTGGLATEVVCNDSDGGTSLTIPKNSSGTCGYTATDVGSQLADNTATATRDTVSVSSGAVAVNWQLGTKYGFDAHVTDTNGQDIQVSSGGGTSYRDSATCSTDTGSYTDGSYPSGAIVNDATVTWNNGFDSSTATTSYDCYIPSISKTAAGAYDERHEWFVSKEVSPLTQAAFIGDTVYFDWTINVTEEVYEENFDVSGTITVNNPNLEDDLVVPLEDWMNGTQATIDQSSCNFDGTYLTVAAGGSETCDYTANDLDYDDVDLAPDTNTATITLNGIDFQANAGIGWTPNVIRGSATLMDDQKPYLGVVVYDGWTSTYPDSYTCSTDLADYSGGSDLDNEVSNTAEVYSGAVLQDSATATTEIDCYLPSISKTAQGYYDERHEWDVEKTVDPLSQIGHPGDVLSWTWTITVFEDIFEENFDVSGTITVNNPNPEDTLVVSLEDFINGYQASISDCAFAGGYLTVAAGGSEVCQYQFNDLPYNDVDLAPDTNTATITLNGIDFSDDAEISYRVNVIRGSATLSDDEIGLIDESVSGGDQPTGSDSIQCSTDRAAYGDLGYYGSSITNLAVLTDSEGNQYSDDATTAWLCEASFVDLKKTTNGVVDPTKDIRFDLYGQGGVLDSVTTLGDGDGILEFDAALSPGSGYTICESPVPAGYTFEITVNGGNVLTFAGPPGSSNPTGEIQCFNFTAADSPTTILFYVNNRYPGGAPRTPGYWKNWNTCSGGNQASTAAALGGVAEGVFLLDDLIPQPIGSYIVESCNVGVLLLDSRSVDKAKNMSNDAAYTLAKALLAARLNQDAGACVPLMSWGDLTSFEQVLTAADNLLAGIGFDGTGSYLGPKNKQESELRSYALYLYGIIDTYNNSGYCTGTPSH